MNTSINAIRLITALSVVHLGEIQIKGEGIPEPDLIFYGSVINRTTNQPMTTGDVIWQISNGAASVGAKAMIVNVNGQFFYIARVPMETRSVGTQALSAAPNTLGLTPAAVTYTRAARVGEADATIVSSSRGMLGTFTVSSADRGLIERVDLAIGTGGTETFEQWLARFGLPTNTDPNADPLGKGMNYLQQFIAGTDPTQKDSVFKFVDIRLDLQGLSVVWTSFSGRSYTIERSEDLGKSFSILQEHIAGVPPSNTFRDASANGKGPYFYRIRVE